MTASAAPGDAARQPMATAREKLIVALDVPSVKEAEALVETLGDSVSFYKIGLGLQLAGVDGFLRALTSAGKRVFLDYKYLDIEETVRSAVAGAARVGVDFLTVHGVGNILKGAVEGKQGSPLKIFCVTVLTSMDAADVREMGFPCEVEDLVMFRAKKALSAGCDGVIASAHEAARIKKETGNALLVVTPGIRPAGTDHNDQKRVATPRDAIRAGADYLVIGRPITRDPDPVAAAEMIVGQIADALAG